MIINKLFVSLRKKYVQIQETGKTGLFDKEKRREKLSAIGNPLEKISKVIDF